MGGFSDPKDADEALESLKKSTTLMQNGLDTMKQAEELGVKLKELQAKLKDTEIDAVEADGATVVMSGTQIPVSIKVSDELLAKGSQAVSDAVSLAVGQAYGKSLKYKEDRTAELYTSMGVDWKDLHKLLVPQ